MSAAPAMLPGMASRPATPSAAATPAGRARVAGGSDDADAGTPPFSQALDDAGGNEDAAAEATAANTSTGKKPDDEPASAADRDTDAVPALPLWLTGLPPTPPMPPPAPVTTTTAAPAVATVDATAPTAATTASGLPIPGTAGLPFAAAGPQATAIPATGIDPGAGLPAATPSKGDAPAAAPTPPPVAATPTLPSGTLAAAFSAALPTLVGKDDLAGSDTKTGDALLTLETLDASPATPGAGATTLTARNATIPPPIPGPPVDLRRDDAGQEIGQRLMWMTEQRISHARIELSPENMGRIEVSVRLDGDKVYAQFGATQADVRSSLEASLPRLREMLGQQGLSLAQADVGKHGQGQQTASPRRPDDGLGRPDDVSAMSPPAAPPSTRPRWMALLDEYA